MDDFVESESTVGELRELYLNGGYDIEIDTPDGWQRITRWWDKGELPLVKIATANGLQTECAFTHLLESPTNGGRDWRLACEVKKGDCLLTIKGPSEVISREDLDPTECFDFEVDHPNHRYWGDGFSSHNSGKSFLASGNIAANAQKAGHFVVLLDSENALDSKWLEDLGVDTSESKLLKVGVTMIDDVAKLIYDFVKGYRQQYEKVSRDERPKVLFVIDSLGMLLTPTDVGQFGSGELKGDMGRKPKSLNALVRNCINMFGDLDIGLVATNHTYASQDLYDPEPKIQGGSGFIYASSIVVAMRKKKLKEDEEGNPVKDIRGILAQCKCVKTRYNKPFEQIEIKIPWDRGMDPYSGLIELLEQKGLFVKDGHSLRYDAVDGKSYKQLRKNITPELLDKVMNEFVHQIEKRKQQTPPSSIDDDLTEDAEVLSESE